MPNGPNAIAPRFISIPVTAVVPDEKAPTTKMKSADNQELPFSGRALVVSGDDGKVRGTALLFAQL
ncbi:MAG: hypothetical protein EBS79_08095 [Gammaproteobacteria bacterium]|nr:hypothetical protein [Gammaproteobacteria bacterium]NBY21842.1 hypothetical protein [Gammaproteobacteria bacterium]